MHSHRMGGNLDFIHGKFAVDCGIEVFGPAGPISKNLPPGYV